MTSGATQSPDPEFPEELAAHRPALLRHCYRMLGSFADAEDLVQEVLLRAWRSRDTYAGDAPLDHWLFRIATNACLNEIASRKRRARALPQLEHDPAPPTADLVQVEGQPWLTPAPDSALFAGPARALETRETVALAFLALLQRLPPRQRAVLLLKDVVGWSAEEIASGLEMTLGSVNSALHRARQSVATRPAKPVPDPPPDVLAAYVRSWESHDIEGLVSLLRHDVVFAMPPFSTWFRGASDVRAFLETPMFSAVWTNGFRLLPTRANGQLAIAFYRRTDDGYRRRNLQLLHFEAEKLAESITFIGEEHLRGFELPEVIERVH